MMKNYKNNYIVLFFLAFVNIMYAQNTTEVNFSTEETVNNTSYVVAERDSIWKWAWTLPTYAEKHAYLKGRPWLEPNGVGELTVIGSHKRENDDSDTYSFATLTSIRPFALDFDTFSIAFGISFLTRVNRLEDITKEINVEAFDGFDLVDVAANGLQNHANQFFVNFSALASFPELGLQVMLDVGFGQSNIREIFDKGRAEVLEVAELLYEDYQYKQIDDMLFAAINIFKSFDRPYLNFIQLFVYGSYRLKTKTRESKAELTSDSILNEDPDVFNKQDLPFFDDETVSFFPDPQIPDEFNLSFIGADLIVRLFTIYTPLIENRGISVNLYAGFTHISGQLLIEDFHGLQSKFGVQLGIFDGVNIRYSQIFEQGNDQENGFELMCMVQVSALIRELIK